MISLLIVNYRSRALAVEAIRSARATTARPLQVVVVDNSCDEREAAALRPHCDVVIAPLVNRGYAGAINEGRRRCDGEVIVVSNPDVIYGERAIEILAGTLAGRITVAGPALYWDEGFRWVLPPSDLHTGTDEVDRILASRSVAWWRARDRRRIRQRIAFWSVAEPLRVRAISGAVMAIRAEAFDRAGGFDERFALYFEENDFLRRIDERRERIAYVPAARCQHLYNQSASQESAKTAALYAESEAKYLAKWNGPLAARLLERLRRPPAEHPAVPLDGALEVPAGHLVEISPDSSFEVAAGHFRSGSERLDLPPAAWDAFRGDRLYLRTIERSTARVGATYVRYKS
jgi:N-acetylglucosaminyl-diphospho-decaprenol L-rhamnosyltransferase